MASGAYVDSEDSRRGTRGQLVGGTVKVQVADFRREGTCRLSPSFPSFSPFVQHLVRLFENFWSWNVALISFGEGLDFSTSMGKLFYQLSGVFAEFERDCIRERVKAGLRKARAKGKRLGRPCISVDAARIGRLHSHGRSVREIAGELGYSRGLVHKTLVNRRPAGAANAD